MAASCLEQRKQRQKQKRPHCNGVVLVRVELQVMCVVDSHMVSPAGVLTAPSSLMGIPQVRKLKLMYIFTFTENVADNANQSESE